MGGVAGEPPIGMPPMPIMGGSHGSKHKAKGLLDTGGRQPTCPNATPYEQTAGMGLAADFGVKKMDMNTNTTIDPRVTEFLKLLESAGAVNAGGPLLSSWDIAEPNGEDDNEVVSFSWVDDDGLGFGYTLSEAGIAGGKWVGDCFFCEDTEGYEAQIRIFKLVAMVPDAYCIEPSKGSEPDAFNYQLLARLKQDCEYYLGHGNRATKRLWAGSEAEQIATMKEIYAVLRDKPEWISLEDIARYEAKMLKGAEPIPSRASGNTAYEATVEDVENVLRSNSLAVGSTNGKSFEAMANELHGNLDFDLIEQAALAGDDLDEQTGYANDEIARQLRETGVLEPLKQAHDSPSPGM